MASPAPEVRILPAADREESADELLSRAETLGIPWRRLLVQEIEAEERLRAHLPELTAELPWDEALEILSAESSRSFRVRDQLEALAWQARASVKGAERKLRDFVQTIRIGGSKERAVGRSFDTAYRRILLLQRARRAAARCGDGTMTTAERLAFVCTRARCRFEDAEWAIGVESSPRRGRRMEAAIRKVRDEGYFVPRAATEARSLASLRRIVFGFRDASPRNRRARAS